MITTKGYDLLVLPKQFKEFPAQAIDIYMCGIVPQDFEEDWNSKLLRTVKCWLDDNITEKVHVEAKIRLSLNNFILVNSLYLVEKLQAIKTEVNVISIKKELLRKKLAVQDSEGMYTMLRMANDCGEFKI